MSAPIRTPFEPPEEGAVVEVAAGVHWARMPLPPPLGHVNVYAFDEGTHWTIVDTGVDTKTTRRAWQALLDGPLAGKPVARVIVTHHHLDHIGLAGWFMREHGAELVTTRTAYLTARMLQLDVQERPTPETLAFWRSCGMSADVYAEREAARPFNTSDAVGPIPLGYTRVRDGDEIHIGGRAFDVRCGDGHAPEHATFWAREGDLVIGGDQLLGAISPNLGLHATEPEADPIGDWLVSCQRFQPYATDAQLVLTGHKLPYTGLPARLSQLVDNHHKALERLLAHLAAPHTATECFEPLFRRPIKAGEYGLAMVEAIAHCHHLFLKGLVSRDVNGEGAYVWQARG